MADDPIFLRHPVHVQVFRDTVWVWAVSTAAVAGAGEDRSEIFERHGGDRETVSLHPLRPAMPRQTPQQRHLQPRLESGSALSRRPLLPRRGLSAGLPHRCTL